MFAFLKSLFGPSAADRQSLSLYHGIVEAARAPVFYKDLAVPDTVEGRFDVIILHLALLVRGIEHAKGPEGATLVRGVQEMMIKDMDRSLREMGVGDMSIGKKVQGMGEAWFGRLQAYQAAFESDAPVPAMSAALAKNIFEGGANAEALERLSHYVMNAAHQLSDWASTPVDQLTGDGLKVCFKAARGALSVSGEQQ